MKSINDDEKRIVSYLNDQGIEKIDYLISTHPDADHSGGLDAVVDHFDIGQVFVSNGESDTQTYQDFMTSLSEKKLQPEVPFELEENTYIQFYNTESTAADSNDLSLITLLVCGEKNFVYGRCWSRRRK